jgi:uncharacterized protein (UPF0335 family)
MLRSPGVKDKTEAEKHIAEAKLRQFLAKLGQRKQNSKSSDQEQIKAVPEENN